MHDARRRRRFRVLALSFTLVALIAACAGRPVALPNQSPGPLNPGQPNNPGQQATGAPGWVKPGMRLTWYGAAASIAQSSFQWVEQPCNSPQATWTDARSGKCYSRTDEGPTPQDPPTAAGDGLSVIDVIAVEGDNAVLANTLYTFDRSTNAGNLLWAPVGGGSVNGSSIDGAWIHPQTLAQIAQSGFGDLFVFLGKHRVGNTTYDAISLASGLGGTSSYHSYTYDRASGILLSANTSSGGGVTTPLVGPNDPRPPQSNTQLTMARFQGSRERTMPGTNGTNPDWVASTSQLTYQGTHTFVNPVDPTSANLTHPLQQVIQLGDGGANWRSFTARTIIQGLGQDTSHLGVTGPTGVYWWDPTALAAMSNGQVLDQDPFTGEQMTVSFVGQSANGTPVVVIDTQLPGNFIRATYELSSGLLVAFDTQAASTGTSISLGLVDRR